MVTLRLLAMTAAVAAKVAVVAPAATLIEVGVVSTALLSEIATLAPPVRAALVKLTVHVLEALGPRLLGVQASDDTSTGATRLMVALAELPLYAAAMLAL
jgi:hypothetical protein